ncbi:MAG: ComEC/Rec2 family competence protein, partial [Verrucomicrobia bacterium]|nr:ComEC/Rec2 family competence protein [Verrucomicrobiota bacterium]
MDEIIDDPRRHARHLEFILRPIVALTVCVLAALRLGLEAHVTPLFRLGVFCSAVFCLALSAFLAFSKIKALTASSRHIGIALLYAALALGAWVRGSLWAGDRQDARLDAFLNQSVEMVGRVTSDPQRYASTNDGTERWRFDFIVDRIRIPPERWVSPSGSLDVLWFNHIGGRRPCYGQELSILNKKIRKSRYERRFVNHLRVSTGAGDVVLLSEENGNPFLARCYRARTRAAHSLAIGVSAFHREVGLMHALLLGLRTALDKEVNEMAVKSGTVHIFAVSGLHLGIFVGLVVFVLNFCRISRAHWILFLTPLLVGYTAMIGAPPSAVRACVMALIYFAAPILGRRADIPSSVAAAAL